MKVIKVDLKVYPELHLLYLLLIQNKKNIVIELFLYYFDIEGHYTYIEPHKKAPWK